MFRRLNLVLCLIVAVLPTGCRRTPASTTPAAFAPGKVRKPASTRPLYILFIGNSYTYVNELPWVLKALTLSAGPRARPVEVDMEAYPSATLKSHLDDGYAARAIHSRQWDYVVIQEQSHLENAKTIDDPRIGPVDVPGDPARFYKYARRLDTMVRNAGARSIFLMTWAPKVHPSEQATLSNAYRTISRELNEKVAPVGEAFAVAIREHPEVGLYGPDGRHPSKAGTYLAACVLYRLLENDSPTGLSPTLTLSGHRRGTPAGTISTVNLVDLPDAEAASLQRVAGEAFH